MILSYRFQRRMQPGSLDANHKPIVRGLRKYGFSVLDLSTLGDGIPDLLVGVSSLSMLVEIKTESGELNEAQRDFRSRWQGQVLVVRSLEHALDLVTEEAARLGVRIELPTCDCCGLVLQPKDLDVKYGGLICTGCDSNPSCKICGATKQKYFDKLERRWNWYCRQACEKAA